MEWTLKKSGLLLCCGTFLFIGSTFLYQQARIAFFDDGAVGQPNTAQIYVKHTRGHASDLQGAFTVDSIDNYSVLQGGKDVFSLLLAHYRDADNQERRAVLFPKSNQKMGALPSATELRQTIWLDAAKAISKNTTKDALILSWWDDGQRIHLLSGREAWISKPSAETFISPVWKSLQDNLILASDSERGQLSNMAHWLTMDCDKALAEMRKFFGNSRPIYLLVTNDLLSRLSEMKNYGGALLSVNSKTVPAHDNLHGDIALIKQWAHEEGDGNYLVQKMGLQYHIWATPKGSTSEKNALLIRLLPFVDSLKKLPEHVNLVYQSHWGGYLSIYRIDG